MYRIEMFRLMMKRSIYSPPIKAQLHKTLFLQVSFLQQQDMDIGSGKNLLPSISEDDEERGSEDEDKSPVSTSPRSPLHNRTTTRFNFSRSVDVVEHAPGVLYRLPPHSLNYDTVY